MMITAWLLPLLILLQVKEPDFALSPGANVTALTVLGGVVTALCGMLWRLYKTSNETQVARDKVLMEFVDRVRSETFASIDKISERFIAAQKENTATVSSNFEQVRTVMSGQTRGLENLYLSLRLLTRIEDMKKRGVELTTEELDRVVRLLREETKV